MIENQPEEQTVAGDLALLGLITTPLGIFFLKTYHTSGDNGAALLMLFFGLLLTLGGAFGLLAAWGESSGEANKLTGVFLIFFGVMGWFGYEAMSGVLSTLCLSFCIVFLLIGVFSFIRQPIRMAIN